MQTVQDSDSRAVVTRILFPVPAQIGRENLGHKFRPADLWSGLSQ